MQGHLFHVNFTFISLPFLLLMEPGTTGMNADDRLWVRIVEAEMPCLLVGSGACGMLDAGCSWSPRCGIPASAEVLEAGGSSGYVSETPSSCISNGLQRGEWWSWFCADRKTQDDWLGSKEELEDACSIIPSPPLLCTGDHGS
jgi:hypothetical protein